MLRRASASVVALRTARTHPQRPVEVTVSRVEDLTRSMRRVTLTGAVFPALGTDQYARLLLPRAAGLVLPTTQRWYPELLAMNPATRPWLRNYTLRAVRPESREVDVDVVLHDGAGPAVTWAAAAGPGDRVGLIEQGAPFRPSGRPLLVVADDTGLPAALSILEGLPPEVPATAVLEVCSAADEQPTPPGAVVRWVHRDDGDGAADAVAALDLEPGQAWLAGEASLATGLRRHLVRDRGFAKADVSFAGYYRRGRPQYRL